ncbi:hypothetical protein NQ314_014660 [Rhamnusium bicolor]|uniref:Glyceraldehyde 3-phosphate dehydrogenase catalytic domain-containing protein n=1 Tax=Rhamnusium bicolor TaxID=1586634 RepID=A0AAV8X113_9CUCU|nr:hypothetical protein NQ314_014660 [Rhamnusium bicolor]
MSGIMRITDEELVSTDLIGDIHSCIVDGKAGVPFSKCTVKLFAWYDSEYAFANRLYDLANYIASRDSCAK